LSKLRVSRDAGSRRADNFVFLASNLDVNDDTSLDVANSYAVGTQQLTV
jgi:hypothetical protein